MTRERLYYSNTEHSISVYADCDWGGPCEYKVSCRCGWKSIKRWTDVLFVDGSGTVGSEYNAFKEGLAHMGVTVLDYIESRENDITSWLKSIVQYTEAINSARAEVGGMRDLV